MSKKSFWYLAKLKLEIFTAALIGARPDCEVLDADDKWEVANSQDWLPARIQPFFIQHDTIYTKNISAKLRIDWEANPENITYLEHWWKLYSVGETLTKSSNHIFSTRERRVLGVRIQLRSFVLEGKLHRVAIWDFA